MERAPFEWSEDFDSEHEAAPPRVERPMPSGQPTLGQPYIWAAPQPRPRFRYMDDTPKMGRVGGAAFLGFLVLLAFGAVWVIEQDFEGPSTKKEPVPQAAKLDTPAESPVANVDNASLADDASPAVASPVLKEPPPVIGTHEPPANRIPFPTTPPLSQQYTRTPAIQPTPAPTPAPAPALPPATASVPPPASVPAPAPEPPRLAAAEPAPTPLPREAVEEPVLAPPVTPPPEPPPPPARAAAPAPAPAAAPTTAARVPTGDVDNSAIRDVLGRYRTAYNTLDAKAAQQVWPSVNERTLDRAFAQLQQQNVSFDRCTIAVKGVMAEANCNGTTRFVPRVGSRSEQIEPRQWNFSLRKAYSGGWVIQNVDAR